MLETLLRHRQQLLLLGSLFALSIADAVITRFIVSTGLGAETNPFLRPVVLEANFHWIKVLGSLATATLLWHLYIRHGHKVIPITAFFVSLYMLVVYWNLGVVFLGNT